MSGSGESSDTLPANTILIEEGKDYLLEPGDELPYRLIRSLGHGHSGNVEEVEDIRTSAIYARKTIRIYGSRDNAERRRIFENEMKIIRSLASHHHIIQIFATYVAKREVGLILQPVADDGDLDAFLDRFREDAEESEATDSRKVADQTKITILKRAFGCLASGLDFMHRLKVRHKDIKPRNILIHQGMVLYTDFGYSLDSSHSNHSTTAGRPDFFTRRYSAPEVLDHEPRNSRSDVFSLGCVFIEILSVLEKNLEIDQGLCFGENIDRVHRRLGEDKSKSSSGFLEDLSEICISMTHREPSSRFTVSQVLTDIQQSPGYFCQRCELARPRDSDDAMLRAGSSLPHYDVISNLGKAVEGRKSSGFMSVVASSTVLAPSNDPRLAGKLTENGSTEVITTSWIWSSEHQDFYYATRSHIGQWTYHWYKEMPQPTPAVSTSWGAQYQTRYGTSPPNRSSYSMTLSPDNGMEITKLPCDPEGPINPVYVPEGVASTIPNMISGTPEKGWYEPLDSSYRMRPETEAHSFFKIGKVFAMLYTHMSVDLAGPGIDNTTIVKYGEKAYSQIRRYVVVQVRKHFVYACPISTYSGRGTLKHGVDANEHSIAYFVGTKPASFQDEYLTKDSIAIMPADMSQVMSTGSRLHYAKAYPIEKNVKVKEIGNVIPEDLPKLIQYYREEQTRD